MKIFYNAYIVYPDGRVQNKNTKRFLKPEINKVNGYARYTLCTNGKTKRFLAHRLVAMLYIKNPKNKPEVNHKDGNKLNNVVENLEWNTRGENELHSYKVLGKQVPRGIDRWNAKFTDEDIHAIREYAKTATHQATADKFSCSRQYVSDLVSGRYRK